QLSSCVCVAVHSRAPTSEAAEIDDPGRRRIPGVQRGVPGAELAVRILAPAADIAGVEDGARVRPSRGDGADASPAALADGGQKIAGLAWPVAVGEAHERGAEPRVGVVSPALDLGA